MPFSSATLRFLRGLAANNNKPWFEANRATYDGAVREPMRELVVELDRRLARFAPEMGGDPRRSVFRINRDIRFSRDKSPYKTNAGCWFYHRAASSRVGAEASMGSAGFYFHLQPGESFVGAGLWMPPRDQLQRLREAIADEPRGLERIVRALPRRFRGLDDEAMLTRMPRGYSDNHPAARWLRFQSFTTGRTLTDAQVVGAKLPALLEREFGELLPLVRWLNRALGHAPTKTEPR